jgi:hypothetical protein
MLRNTQINSCFVNFNKTLGSFDWFSQRDGKVYGMKEYLLAKIVQVILEILVDYASTLFCWCNALHGLYRIKSINW